MAQVLCMGASSLYGVGGQEGGWPDYLKRDIHAAQFAPGGSGERHELYNLGKPGVATEFIIDNLDGIVQMYLRAETPLILVFNVGGNDARAWKEPNAFVCTPEEFSAKLKKLLEAALVHTKHVFILGQYPVNEAVVNPKENPWDGTASYFYNQRRQLFEELSIKVAQELGAEPIPLFNDAEADGWQNKYMYTDGLHPNSEGHKWIYEQIRPKLSSIMDGT